MQTFELNLSSVLAYSLVLDSKTRYSPNGIVDDARNGGDPTPTNAGESTASVLNAYTKYFPQLMQASAGAVAPTERELFKSRLEISPQEQELNAQLYNHFGPKLNAIGQQIARQNALSQAETDRQVQSGTGKDLITSNLELNKIADPEFYASRALVGDGLRKLLSGMDPNKLTGSEEANVERAVNRSNATNAAWNPRSQLTGISSALQFDDRLQQKRSQFGQAIALAAGALPSTRSGIDTFQLTTGKPSVSDYGAGKFTGVKNTGQETFGMGNNFLQGINATQIQRNQLYSNKRDSLDRVNETMSSV